MSKQWLTSSQGQVHCQVKTVNDEDVSYDDKIQGREKEFFCNHCEARVRTADSFVDDFNFNVNKARISRKRNYFH